MQASEVIEQIEKHIVRAGTQKALAKQWGISQQYLSEVRAGRKDPGDKILKNLNLERIVTYEKTKENRHGK
jgi:predicted transcriptional regulator